MTREMATQAKRLPRNAADKIFEAVALLRKNERILFEAHQLSKDPLVCHQVMEIYRNNQEVEKLIKAIGIEEY